MHLGGRNLGLISDKPICGGMQEIKNYVGPECASQGDTCVVSVKNLPGGDPDVPKC